MGAPDGPFVFWASEPQTLSGDQFLSLTPTTLFFVGRSLGGHDFDRLWAQVVPLMLLMGPSVCWESELKLLSGDRFSSSTPQLPCIFVGRSLGGHEFDGLWVRAVPSALLMGPFVCRESELRTLSGDQSDALTPPALSFCWPLTWWA